MTDNSVKTGIAFLLKRGLPWKGMFTSIFFCRGKLAYPIATRLDLQERKQKVTTFVPHVKVVKEQGGF